MNRRGLIAATAAAALGALKTGTDSARAAVSGRWNWITGDERAYVAGSAEGDSLALFALQDVNIGSNHLRMSARDGNFEFEHDAKVAASTLNAYVIGTGTRTPIAIGGWDDQDVVSLIVGGTARQHKDIQQWQLGGRTVAAIDAAGALRLGPITISGALENGRAVLVATLPDGSRQTLATGTVAPAATAAAAATAKQATPARAETGRSTATQAR